MPLVLDIPSDLEQRLKVEAGRRGLSVAEYTLDLLAHHVPAADRQAAAVGLLQSWIDKDSTEEQKETGDFLIRHWTKIGRRSVSISRPDLKGSVGEPRHLARRRAA